MLALLRAWVRPPAALLELQLCWGITFPFALGCDSRAAVWVGKHLVCEQWCGSVGAQAVFMVFKAGSWHCLPEQAGVRNCVCFQNHAQFAVVEQDYFKTSQALASFWANPCSPCLVCLGIFTVPHSCNAVQQLPQPALQERK